MINQAALAQGAGGPERRSTMRKRIAVMKGDGIGPEIVNEALKVLETVASKYGHHFAYNFVDIGGVAIDNYGTPLPQATIDACLEADSVLLGAVVLLAADTVGRTIVPGMEIPVGIVMSVTGGPFFLYMLRKKGKVRGN